MYPSYTKLLFAIVILISPNIANAFWPFDPGSYAECMKEEMKESYGVTGAKRYIHDYCYNEFCNGKGEWITIENPNSIRCKELRALLNENDKSACEGYPHGVDAGYGGSKSGGVNCERRLFSDRERLDCKCTRWMNYSREFRGLNCNNMKDRKFIYNDSSCP